MTGLRSTTLFLSISLGIHILLVGLFFFVERSPEVRTPDPIPLDFQVVEKSAKATGGKTGTRSLTNRGDRARNLAKNLMTSLNANSFWTAEKGFQEDPTRMVPHVDFKDPRTYSEGDAGPFGEYSYFHSEVYRQINTRLIYQSLLAQYKHRGWVYFQFDVDPEGKLISESLQASASDPILKVHSARAIRAGLAAALDENKQAKKFKRSTFVTRFYFGTKKEEKELICTPSSGSLILTFCRFASEKAVSTNLKDHLLTGGITFNPFLVEERWEQYKAARIRRAGDFDPFSDYRKDPDYNL